MLDNERFPEIRRSNMTPLRSLKLRCAKCSAGGSGPTLWAMYLPAGDDDARQFLSGYDVKQAEV